MEWNEQQLRDLRVQKGFRLRGLEMTRLEAFADAAFAFAITLMVISLQGIPDSFAGLIDALKGAPAFAASFATIAAFWYGHRHWSRRFGLEDGPSILISLLLIFIMLVYVYPLKMVFLALFSWISGGWLPSNFTIQSADELAALFIVYGVGFFALSGTMVLLYARARSLADSLRLDARERLKVRGEIAAFGTMALTGLASALLAWLAPPWVGIWAGFVYSTLPVSMPLVSAAYDRRVRRLDEGD